MRKIGILVILTLTPLLSAQAVSAAELITNGGFEAGIFTGWTATNGPSPFEVWRVSGGGFGFTDTPVPVATQVVEGSFNAWESVASNAGSFLLSQDVTIPAGQIAIFRWKHRYQMNLSTYCGGSSQPACGTATFAVEILNTSNVLLQTVATTVTAAGSNTNTGWVSGQTNLSSFNGQTIRVRFRTTVTTNYAGPGRLEVDAVSIQSFPPTASGVSVGGRVVTAGGMGIAGATVTIVDPAGNPRTTTTTSLGYYQFDEVEVGNNYVMSATAKGRSFVDSPVVIAVNDNIGNQDFHAAM
jgi:Carboxypeptidase regulatory-like domain